MGGILVCFYDTKFFLNNISPVHWGELSKYASSSIQENVFEFCNRAFGVTSPFPMSPSSPCLRAWFCFHLCWSKSFEICVVLDSCSMRRKLGTAPLPHCCPSSVPKKWMHTLDCETKMIISCFFNRNHQQQCTEGWLSYLWRAPDFPIWINVSYESI